MQTFSMRYLRYVAATVFVILFLGCYEVNEEIMINSNGSGVYATRMDMSQLLEMLQTMGGEEELSKEGLDRSIDTVINLKDVMDSSQKASPEQKELVKDGKLHLRMDIANKVFITDINIPFKNLGDLQKSLSGMGGSGSGMSQIFKSMFDKGGSTDSAKTDAPSDPADNQLDQLSNVFDVVVKDGLISKKINTAKLKTLTDKPEMAQMKELGSSGIELLYTTTIRLPRPIKKIDNTLIKVSDDKKTLTFKYNLLDMFETPEKFSYSVEY
jgi:hypothetical protein